MFKTTPFSIEERYPVVGGKDAEHAPAAGSKKRHSTPLRTRHRRRPFLVEFSRASCEGQESETLDISSKGDLLESPDLKQEEKTGGGGDTGPLDGDDESFRSNPSETSGSTGGNAPASDPFTHRESQILMILKWLIYAMFALSAIGMGVGYFFSIASQQGSDFEIVFETMADQSAAALKTSIDSLVNQLSSIGSGITAQTFEHGAYPNMTFFEEQVSHIFANPSVVAVFDMDGNFALQDESNLDVTHLQADIAFTLSIVDIQTLSPMVDGVSFADGHQAILTGTMSEPIFFELFELDKTSPYTLAAVPTYQSFEEGSPVEGVIFTLFSWTQLLQSIPTGEGGPLLINVMEGCGSGFAYIVGEDSLKTPPTDWESTSWGPSWAQSLAEVYSLHDVCAYDVEIHPTQAMYSTSKSDLPIIFFIFGGCAIVLLCGLFHCYAIFVRKRQGKLLATTNKTHAVVTSLFPAGVHNRLLSEAPEAGRDRTEKRGSLSGGMKSANIHAFLMDKVQHEDVSQSAKKLGLYGNQDSKPIADLFPEATIMFADIVGFTAWSSTREPSQVFTLLETIYSDFDEVARRRKVFKVETIGDCYVAVAGLPVKTVHHALMMARFAAECRIRFVELVKDLEKILGPDTTELGIRIGLHSGPVTAGVLRGDRARFQLFGDTVNTTARIEATSAKNQIQISQETKDFLLKAGKAHWFRPREDKVTAKGKGELNTFWLHIAPIQHQSTNSAHTTDSQSISQPNVEKSVGWSDQPRSITSLSEKQRRVVNWITLEMAKLLKSIELSRDPDVRRGDDLVQLERQMRDVASTPLDEATSIIQLSTFKECPCTRSEDDIVLDLLVFGELRTFIEAIAELYVNNPFHNFEHASHVTMSVIKLMSRIVAPDDGADSQNLPYMRSLHEQTYGIASDALAQFAIVLSALFHDAGHQGVPNSVLVKEEASVAILYDGKSCAEQNSVDLCWNLLMEDRFSNLRSAIYHSDVELKRFRQLVVNTVLATDIMDKQLATKRKERWEVAFSGESGAEDPEDAANRRATIVIEHIIQASDVAHTMQHWHVYRKWNGRLFEEMHQAYMEGRINNDPSENWYEGEIGFFDFYIIPLAKKLKECGVFGVSSDEYLNYAIQNRRQWEANGRQVVEELTQKVQANSFTTQRASD